MNQNLLLVLYALAMALTTYLIRMLPLVLITKQIKNRFLRSFLYYVPYTVLGTMTVPAIFYCTGNAVSAIVGLVTAVLMALKFKSLMPVAAASCVAVYITELIMRMI